MKKHVFITIISTFILICAYFLYINFFAKKIVEPKLEEKISITDIFKDVLSKHKHYKKDTYILFDCLYDKDAEPIDAYSLFLHMREKNLKAYYVVLKDTNLFRKLEQENNLENIIAITNYSKLDGREFIYSIYDILPKTKAIITSFGTENVIDYYFNQIPYLKYIFIQHGQVFFKESVMNNGYINSKKFDNILVSSNIEANIFKKYGWSDDKLIKSALPRWDLLNNKNSIDEKSIFIMLTWRDTSPDRFAKSLYLKRLSSLLYNINNDHFFIDNNVKIYFAPHHAFKANSNISLLIKHKNIEIVSPHNISQYIKKSSILLTDLSSVAFDFMFQNKPVIFYGLDRGDALLEKKQFIDLELLKQREKIFPNIFFNEHEVINKLKYYVNRDFTLEKEISDIYNMFFYIKKDIRDDLLKKIEDIL